MAFPHPARIMGAMTDASEILATARERRLLRERQARETRRAVYLQDGTYVIKHFTLPASARHARTPWRTEDAALRRAAPAFAPHSFGVVERTEGDQREAYLVKAYVPGRVLDRLGVADAPDAAALMAGLHRLGVVTDDANAANFLRTDDGRLLFLDLGRARLHNHAGWALRRDIGRELAKLRREGFAWNRAAWRAFLPVYFSHLACSQRVRVLLISVCATMTLARMLRKTLQGSSWRA
jgi:hypothetical protein